MGDMKGHGTKAKRSKRTLVRVAASKLPSSVSTVGAGASKAPDMEWREVAGNEAIDVWEGRLFERMAAAAVHVSCRRGIFCTSMADLLSATT